MRREVQSQMPRVVQEGHTPACQIGSPCLGARQRACGAPPHGPAGCCSRAGTRLQPASSPARCHPYHACRVPCGNEVSSMATSRAQRHAETCSDGPCVTLPSCNCADVSSRRGLPRVRQWVSFIVIINHEPQPPPETNTLEWQAHARPKTLTLSNKNLPSKFLVQQRHASGNRYYRRASCSTRERVVPDSPFSS